MKNSTAVIILILLLIVPIQIRGQLETIGQSSVIAESGDYWPTDEWQISTPEEHGMNGTLLEIMEDYVYEEELWIHSIVVVKDGYIVYENYTTDDYGPNDIHYVCSVTKSVTSALYGILLKQGYLSSLDVKVLDLFPETTFQNMSPEKENITIEHLLTMTSGLEWDEWSIPYTEDGNDFHDMWHHTGNSFYYVLNKPSIASPGEVWTYSTGTSNLLMKILVKLTNTNGYTFAEENLFEPLGISDYYWLADAAGHPAGGHDLYITPKDMAKIGYLYLNNGTWEDEQLIDSWYVNASQQTHFNLHDFWWSWINDGYGYQWWTETYRDFYYANGQDGQIIAIFPQYDMVVAINGYSESGPLNARDADGMHIIRKFLIPAVRDYHVETITTTASTETTSTENSEDNSTILVISILSASIMSALVITLVVFRRREKMKQ
ncbi:MAG: serine hydrolase domain-containing protein [Candidatus Thorarchaeota archaeon]